MPLSDLPVYSEEKRLVREQYAWERISYQFRLSTMTIYPDVLNSFHRVKRDT